MKIDDEIEALSESILISKEIETMAEILEKGRTPMPVGTVRTWSNGVKAVKHADGWVVLGGKNHGKLMGKFKEAPTHAEFADEHHGEKKKPKPEAIAEQPAKEEKPKAKPLEPQKVPVKKEPASSKKKGSREMPELTLRKNEATGQYEIVHADGSVVYKTNPYGVTDDHQKAIAEKALNDMIEQNKLEANAHNMTVKEWLSAVGVGKSKRHRDIWGLRHKTRVMDAVKHGYEIPQKVLDDYPELQGLPDYLQDANQERTNLFKSVNLKKVPKKRQKEVLDMLKGANALVAHMGLTLKVPLHFQADSSLKGGDKKSTRAVYIGGGGPERTVALKDVSQATTSIMHEIGHGIDYAMAESESARVTRSEEINKLEGELKDRFQNMMELIQTSEKYKSARVMSPKHARYLDKPTEVFARAFEVYSLVKAKKLIADGKLDASFTDNYMPDVYKDAQSPERVKLLDEMATYKKREEHWHDDYKKIVKEYQDRAEKELTEETNEDIKGGEPASVIRAVWATDQIKNDPRIKAIKEEMQKNRDKWSEASTKYHSEDSWVIPKEKQAEYEAKIEEHMDYILKHDKIRKAINEVDFLEKSKGEGSRGGKIIGHTKSGEPIYESSKRRIAGRLKVDDQWKIKASYHAKDVSAHGESAGHNCDHCGKGIMKIVEVDHPDHGSCKVGEDCAEAITTGEARTRLEQHINEKKEKVKAAKDDAKEKLKEYVNHEARRAFRGSGQDKLLHSILKQANHTAEDGGTLMAGHIDASDLKTFKVQEQIAKEAARLQHTGEGKGEGWKADIGERGDRLYSPEWETHIPEAMKIVGEKLAKKKDKGKSKMEKAQLKQIITECLEKGFEKTVAVEKIAKAASSTVEKIGELWDLVEKAGGAGSRGGKVIGHTKSGKPIYEQGNKGARGWSSADHKDAFEAHQDHGFNHRENMMKHPRFEAMRSHGDHYRTPEETMALVSQRSSDPEAQQVMHHEKMGDHHHGLADHHYEKYKKLQAKEADSNSVKKAFSLETAKDPFTHRNIGHNCHYDVDSYIEKSHQEQSERIAKGGFDYDSPEALQKSENPALDINDLIEKGMDLSATDVEQASFVSQPQGAFRVQSFSETDMLKSLKPDTLWSDDELKTLRKSVEEELEKAEKHVGRTSTGKKIWIHHPHTKEFEDFDFDDHAEAAKKLRDSAEKLTKDENWHADPKKYLMHEIMHNHARSHEEAAKYKHQDAVAKQAKKDSK